MTENSKNLAGMRRLLRRNISGGRLLGYSLANAVGLTVVLAGLMFYLDSRSSAESEDEYFSNDYVVISKHVDGIGFDPVTFSEEEIADIAAQPWARRVERFTSSQFSVYGSLTVGGRGLSSYMFFESIPDDFFDVKPRGWGFNPAEGFIPIIISKDYLTLYNFGFAIPQGLPQLSEEVISAVPLKIRLTGEGHMPEYFDAAIVGFSSRLNTIAVPQSFMDWANARFHAVDGADEPEVAPSRLIVRTDRMKSAEMNAYLGAHGIDIAGDKANEGKISRFLSVVSGVVTVNGLVICALALFILMLSIFLLIQQSREKLRYLMLLGYAPRLIGRYYQRVVLRINVVITFVAVGLTFLFRSIWASQLSEIGLGSASVLPVVGAAAAYLLLVTLLNLRVIRSRLLAIWRG